MIQGRSSGINAPAGYTKIGKDLNKGAGGDYIYLCYKKGGGTPLTDMLVRATGGDNQSILAGYTKIHVDLNDNAGGDFIYLYYQRSNHEDPPFKNGIRPEMMADIGKEYEISRAQISGNKILLRLQKLEFTERIALGRDIPFTHQQTVTEGMKRSEMQSIARQIGVSVNASYGAFSAKVDGSLKSVHQTTFSTSEETRTTQTVALPAKAYNRWYAFVTVTEILRVIKASNGGVISQAQSPTNNRAYFVTNTHGHWQENP